MEFWLISAPDEDKDRSAWDELNRATSKQNNLSINYKFNLPDLKVGTLDALVGLSDDLGKLDSYCESIAKKVAQYLADVLEKQQDKLQENLLANGKDLLTYVTNFKWDVAKYPVKQSLKSLSDIIAKQVNQIETDLKGKSQSYNDIKGNLENLERKQTGSLLTRNVADLVKKDDFVLDSDYLTTILVIIPIGSIRDWWKKYETLSDMVVPRSSKVISEDNEYVMVSVTLFKKVVDEYKHHCRENKFIVRDFEYSESAIAEGKNQIDKLTKDKKKQFSPLVRWLKVNFSESFTAWIHLKALRVFVESVLRYGLPVKFHAMLLHPHKKTVKKLRNVLDNLYAYLDVTGGPTGGNTDQEDIPGFVMAGSDYYPYVFYEINIDMLSK